jgi:hypothetical protein
MTRLIPPFYEEHQFQLLIQLLIASTTLNTNFQLTGESMVSHPTFVVTCDN